MLGRATTVFQRSRQRVRLALPARARAPVPVEIINTEPASFQLLRNIVGPMLSPLSSAGMVLVFAILILLKREDLRDRVLRLAGARDLHRTTAAMNEAAERVSRYLLMQLGVGICYGLPIGIGLAMIGIPNALLWGMLGVVLRFIPYIGGPDDRDFAGGTGDRGGARLGLAAVDDPAVCRGRGRDRPTSSSPGSTAAAPACRRWRWWRRRCSGPGCGASSGCCWRRR